MTWPDSSTYEGLFKNGKMEGRGVKLFANGNRYIGDFKNDNMHGSGVWYDIKAQTQRQGEWKDGKRISWMRDAKPTHVTMMDEERRQRASVNILG